MGGAWQACALCGRAARAPREAQARLVRERLLDRPPAPDEHLAVGRHTVGCPPCTVARHVDDNVASADECARAADAARRALSGEEGTERLLPLGMAPGYAEDLLGCAALTLFAPPARDAPRMPMRRASGFALMSALLERVDARVQVRTFRHHSMPCDRSPPLSA